eukprot:SAG25_NODE_15110_length_167_cov_1.985294_1_plen_37_part_01
MAREELGKKRGAQPPTLDIMENYLHYPNNSFPDSFLD